MIPGTNLKIHKTVRVLTRKHPRSRLHLTRGAPLTGRGDPDWVPGSRGTGGAPSQEDSGQSRQGTPGGCQEGGGITSLPSSGRADDRGSGEPARNRSQRSPPLPVVAPEEEGLREAVRESRAANLVVLVVDASGSMGADDRIAAAKGAVVSLLVDAYERRDPGTR